MPAPRFNPRLIKLHRSYSIDEAARALGAHSNSVRGWIKRGLPVVDRSRPVLILGHELRAFLEGRRKAAKRPCPPGTLYCFKCRAPRAPALGMVDCQPINRACGNLKALCNTCGTIMHRQTRIDAIAAIMPGIAVQLREAGASIAERTEPSLNCDKPRD
jgi:hypothetical protein